MRKLRHALLAVLALAALSVVGCSSSQKGLDLGGATTDLQVSATTGAIEARLVNGNNTPFGNQTVLVSGTRDALTSKSVITDAKGILRLGNLPGGSYTLLAGSVSFSVPVTNNSIVTRFLNLGSPTTVRTDLGELWVVNGLAKTLSLVDTDAGTITNNVVNTGDFPNQVLFRRSTGYIVNSGSNNVQRFNPYTHANIDTIPTGTGTNPYYMVFSSDTKAYISLLLTNKVAVVDLSGATPNVTKTIDVGTAPEGMVAASGRVFVCCANYTFSGGSVTYGQGEVKVINTATDAVESTLQTGPGTNPQFAVLGKDGLVYVLCTGNYSTIGSQVLRINPSSLALQGSALPLTSPGAGVTTAGMIAVAPNGRGFVNDPGTTRIHVIDTTAGTVERTGAQALNVGNNPLGIATSGNGVLWVFNFSDDQVRSLDASSLQQKFAPLDAGDGPQAGGGRAKGLPFAAIGGAR